MKFFQVGQRVRYIVDNAHGAVVKAGDTGVIERANSLYPGVVEYTVKMELSGERWYTYEQSIELVTPVMVYRDEVLRTAVRDMTPVHERFAQGNNALLTNASTGLVNEAGEFGDLVKKWIFHGSPIDKAKALKELGDVRWYLECAAHCLGFTMAEIEAENVKKLRARFPDGFSEAAAAARVDVKKDVA